MLTYSALREIQKKELESGALVELEDDFHSQVLELLKVKKEEAKEGTVMSTREYANIKRIISIIIAKREEKIVLMALRSEKSHIGFTREEKNVFLKVKQLINDYRDNLALESDKKPLIQKIKVTKDLEQYKGSDNKIYGPFKEGEILSLPEEETKWLLKEKIAEKLM